MLRRSRERASYTSIRHYNGQPSFRRASWLDRIPPNFVFFGIIGLNGLVFGMWRIAHDPQQKLFMFKNFAASWQNTFRRPWTLITAAFSHIDFGHILFNGLTFYFFARPVLEVLGSRSFLGFYLASAAISNFAQVVLGKHGFSLGASGAVYSVVTLLACMAPRMTFVIWFIPVPAYLAAPGLFAWDMYWQLKNQQSDTTGHAAHVVGMLSGVGYFLLKRYRIL
ncbi:rhomboid-domain-containing protein [Hymenopellis radicata]|nr:rhomboid-domain-containing protein [Hymenopellis radicata]